MKSSGNEAKRQAIQNELLALSESIKQEHDRHSVELTQIKNQVIDLSDEVGALSFSCLITNDAPNSLASFPDYSGTDPSLFSTPSKTVGSTSSQTYNGHTLTGVVMAVGTRTKYSRQNATTPAGYDPANPKAALTVLNNSQVYDTETMALVGTLPFDSRNRASYVNPSLFYGFSGMQLRSYDIVTGVNTLLKDFTGSGLTTPINIGANEGNQTQDDNEFIIDTDIGNDNGDSVYYNRATNQCVFRSQGQVFSDASALYGGTFNRIDWVSMSLSGYIVARVDDTTNSLRRRFVLYDTAWANPRAIGGPELRAGHAGFVRDANGNDSLINRHSTGGTWLNLNNPTVVMTNIEGGEGMYDGTASLDNPGCVFHSKAPTTSSRVDLIELDVSNYDLTQPPVSGDTNHGANELFNHYDPITTPSHQVAGVFQYSDGGYPEGALVQSTRDKCHVFVTVHDGATECVIRITSTEI